MAFKPASRPAEAPKIGALEFTVASDKDRGARAYQEDSTEVWRPNGTRRDGPVLAVLSDGMGGHVSGEVASRTACSNYVRSFKSGSSPPDQAIAQSMLDSNKALSDAIANNNNLNGMGCTLVAAYVTPEGLRWASVGDSMLLHYRAGKLSRLNQDHSLGAFLDHQAAHNIISVEDAKNDPRRRTLRSALIGQPIPIQDLRVQPFPLESHDWIILASDGLETLSGDEIARVISNNSMYNSPAQVVRTLLDEVKSRRLPHQDNVSIIAIHVINPLEAETQQFSRPPAADSQITMPLSMVSQSANPSLSVAAHSASSADGGEMTSGPGLSRASSQGRPLRLEPDIARQLETPHAGTFRTWHALLSAVLAAAGFGLYVFWQIQPDRKPKDGASGTANQQTQASTGSSETGTQNSPAADKGSASPAAASKNGAHSQTGAAATGGADDPQPGAKPKAAAGAPAPSGSTAAGDGAVKATHK